MSDGNGNVSGRSVFTGSVEGLANTVAAAAAFFGTPPAYNASITWVQEFAYRHYGAGLGDFVQIGWFVIVACAVFFIVRASLATAMVMGGLALAARFL